MTKIGNYAFESCSGLTDVYCFAEEVPSTDSYAFYAVGVSDATLHVPASALDAYSTTAPWSSFGNIVTLTDEELTGVLPIDNGQLIMDNANGVYDLSGRKINVNHNHNDNDNHNHNDNDNLKQLKKGVYIVNGRKVLKR